MATDPTLQERTEHALALHQSGKANEAAQAYQAIIADAPDFPDAYHLFGILLVQAGHVQPGYDNLKRSIELAPDNVGFLTNFVGVLRSLQRGAECTRMLERLISLPGGRSPDHLVMLADGYISQDRYDEGSALLAEAQTLAPDNTDALRLLGMVNTALGKPEQALEHYRRALELGPDISINHYNLGNSQALLCRFDEAIESYRGAIKLEPDMAEAHAHLGTTLMMQGELVEGWPEYEWRWKGEGFPNTQAQAPLWSGAEIPGKTLLLTTEQGYGDAFQFARFVTEAAKRSKARVIVEAQSQIVDLMASIPGIDTVVARGTLLPAFDVQAPFMTLPHILKTTLETIPTDVPYLTPPGETLEKWRADIEALPGRKVGVVWRGNPGQLRNVYRSCPPEALQPLLDIEGVSLVGLQKDPTEQELEKLDGMIDFGHRIETFNDTAAIMCHLDLMVSVCTSTAHLAGALGRPTWVLLSRASDWRWFQDRNDCPWYPTARLFRQQTLNDWNAPVAEIAAQLRG